MAISPRERAVLELHDAGYPPRAIAQELGLPYGYVCKVTEYYSVSLAPDRAHAAAMARGSMVLARAINAAGGHR